MSKNISNEELDKGIKKYLKSKSKKEWTIAILEEANEFLEKQNKEFKKEISELIKLKENEIILGGGRLMAYSLNELFIEFKKGCIHIFNREDLYKFKGKNIILKMVVK